MGPNTAARCRVCVHTSDKAGAGTTAPAFLTAKGEYGVIGERVLLLLGAVAKGSRLTELLSVATTPQVPSS